jgi:Pyridoxamine 5'-phosphate oxidase
MTTCGDHCRWHAWDMKLHESITERLRAFILDQPMFFVATAPSGADGHVNVSPKGMRGTFAVLGEHRVAYLDYFGSGAETIAHLRDNGRITLMFCAFTGAPHIVRLYGRGSFILRDDPEFPAATAAFDVEDPHGARAVILVDVDRVADSCGYAVPLMEYVADRDLLIRAHERRDDDGFAAYGRGKNARSIDGLPALAEARTGAPERG